MIKARAYKKQPMPKHRPRHDGITFAVAHAPNLLAALRIVRAHRATAGADDLLLSVHGDQQRCAEGKSSLRFGTAIDFPQNFSSRFDESRDKWVAGAVTTEDQGVVHHDGRAAVAVHR